MKVFGKYLFKIFFFVNLIYLILAFIVYRRTDYLLSFVRLEFGALIISLILTTAYTIYQLEKGNTIINIILAYLLVLPSLIIIRRDFGSYIFRSITRLYIIFIVIGIIYAIALYVASKRYKKEVRDLNDLLEKQQDKKNKTPE